ncbi:hypothetical protein QA601_07200 [Chitinispirillales bacterium ANBcel5]|uniref:hypothetical protein n=1 Tax=Cellulosispirillum alkaliphilum TaxID=3039283 RepID=UPI002A59727F|nr:hypothetical protein [Chitinispirillales bacterium ANBcel5]
MSMTENCYEIVNSSANCIKLELKSSKVMLTKEQINEIKKYGFNDPEDNCFTLARDAALAAVVIADSNAVLLDKNHGIGGVWEEFPEIPQDQSDITVQPDIALNILNYIKSTLDNGYPVLVGVNVGVASEINDGVTDHFLVMIGYEKNNMGEIVRFFGLDNASSTVPKVEFQVDDNSKMYKPILRGQDRTGVRYIDSQLYVVTQVRVWKQIKPMTNKGVWGRW